MHSIIKQILLVVFLFSPLVINAEAPAIEVSPLIIEEQSAIRDILEYTVKVKNNAKPYKVNLYPVVSDITVKDGKQEMADFSLSSDKTSFLSRWMSFSRGVIDLLPGEEKTLAVKINVNPLALPGKYRAALMFSEAPNSYEAEANAKIVSQPQVIFNITVKENIVERGEISVFKAEQETFLKMPAKILLEIKNIGNKPLVPEGFIYIYDRRGREVDKININGGGRAIESEQKGDFSQIWSSEKAFGRYKAKLEAEYGSGEKRNLQDTIYFWVLPWKILAGFSLLLLALLIILIVANYRRRQILNLAVVEDHETAQDAEREQAGILNLKRK